jgi:hypothetical protein
MYKALLFGLLAAMPSSTNFTLNAYDFGTGADTPASNNYNLRASVGAPGGTPTSSNYALPAGIRASATAPVPPAATLSNPDNSYNRLHLTLNSSGLPGDAKYSIAVSDDNFVTTQYVQPDQTVGTALGLTNYQSYVAWGGAGGFWILGLEHSTSYSVKVAALHGGATGSRFGPTATVATVAPSITFAVTTSLSSSPPFAVGFSSLPPGQVTSGNATIGASVTTNAQHGGQLLVKDQQAGLVSALASYIIASANADLAATGRGYGAQVSTAGQDSGGPITATSPYNGGGHNVGGLTTAWQQLAAFTNPITNGSITLTLKAKSDPSVPAANDYNDTITISLVPSF